MQKVGKKLAGRLLDGIEHNDFPEVAIAVLAERHPFAVLLVMVGPANCQRLSVITVQQVCLGIKGFETIIGAHTLLT